MYFYEFNAVRNLRLLLLSVFQEIIFFGKGICDATTNFSFAKGCDEKRTQFWEDILLLYFFL